MQITIIKNKKLWKDYISRFMRNAQLLIDGDKITVKTCDIILGEWCNNEGYISERRDSAWIWDRLSNYSIHDFRQDDDRRS